MSIEAPIEDPGPIRIYRVTLRDGTSSYAAAHHLTIPDGARGLVLGSPGKRFMCHVAIDGKWVLTYAVDADDVDNVRLIMPSELQRAVDEVARLCENIDAAGVHLSGDLLPRVPTRRRRTSE